MQIFGDHLYQPVKTYSSGMFARLAFACAINVDPDVLIVDEVLSVGDMAFQLKCFKKFEQFKKEGKTILFVTHGISDVIKNCTRTIILENGRKIFDGDVKTGVDKYKKIMVGLDINQEIKEENSSIKDNESDIWKNNFQLNENPLVYGTNAVDIYDYGIFDSSGKYAVAINNDEEVTIKMKIKVNEDINDPIFAVTIKDIKGMEYCGTNTLFNKMMTGNYKKGDNILVEFKQVIPACPGRYTLSFGCTKFGATGDLDVYQRKYDVLFTEVLSYRECVALFDLKSEITYRKITTS